MEEKHTTDIKYDRSLSNTHIQLIALGGTIGTGLFLGVGDSIHLAGPSVILIYLIVGCFMFLLMRALGELILSDLTKHTYIDFIEKYLGKNVGFITGYLYWLSWMTLAMAEVTALGIYFKYWFPGLAPWIPGLIAIILLLLINLISARFFGNLEFSFAIIKIITVMAFVALIAWLLVSGGHTQFGPISFKNLNADGGFFVKGIGGFSQGFQMVIFAFIGIEMIGFTASEVQNPKVTMKKAINQMPVRIIIFYVLAIIAILVTIPWPHVSVNSSPFVQALSSTGINDTGSIINFVVISAAVSSVNSILYSSGRLLFSITWKRSGKWNHTFGHLSRQQVPRNALIFSSLTIACTPIITLIVGDAAFKFISSTCTSMFLLIWLLMVLTHLVYRRQTATEQLGEFRLPLAPFTDYLLFAFFGAVVILLIVLPSYRVSMFTALAIFIILYTMSRFWQKQPA
ncbi:MAG: amino acid permease [Lactobacillus sp.]